MMTPWGVKPSSATGDEHTFPVIHTGTCTTVCLCQGKQPVHDTDANGARLGHLGMSHSKG